MTFSVFATAVVLAVCMCAVAAVAVKVPAARSRRVTAVVLLAAMLLPFAAAVLDLFASPSLTSAGVVTDPHGGDYVLANSGEGGSGPVVLRMLAMPPGADEAFSFLHVGDPRMFWNVFLDGVYLLMFNLVALWFVTVVVGFWWCVRQTKSRTVTAASVV